jgi:PAS domain S-box-containing protein
VFSVIHPDHRERVMRAVQNTDVHRPFVLDVMQVVRRDGSTDWSEWRGRSLFDAEGKHSGYQAVGRIVTDLVLAQRKLAESELQYRSVVEDLRELIVRCDSLGVITFANAAYARTRDCSPDEIVGRSVLESVHPEDVEHAYQQMAVVTCEDPFCSLELRVMRASGDVALQEWNGRAFYDEKRKFLGFQAVGHDITELRRTEARLREKDQQSAHLARVAMLGEMVAGISHEINQPLASIANFSSAAELILEKPDVSVEDQVKLQSWVHRVLQQTERINTIIIRLRRFGRPSSQREDFAIADAATEALLVTESAQRTAVSRRLMSCSHDLPLVNADRIQIEQVLVNLIQNASEAMQETPTISRQMSIDADVVGSEIVVAVTDFGPGITAEQGHDIFQSFVTSKSDGMGIGLAISRSIIESHGGKIRAITDTGYGKIEFSLPISEHT